MKIRWISVWCAILLAQPTASLAWADEGCPGNFAAKLAAAEAGDKWSQYLVGMRYTWGPCPSPDFDKAVAWLTKSAEQGVVEAQTMLGDIYDEADENFVEALKWRLMAAEQGDRFATFKVAQMYYNGQGGAKNTTEAINWYKKSAEQHDWRAQEALSRIYSAGKDVPVDYVEAYRWLALSCGCNDARKSERIAAELAEYASHLSPEQIAEADAWIAEWKKAHPRRPPAIMVETQSPKPVPR